MITTIPIEIFDDNFPYLAHYANQAYEAARNPIPARGKRIVNDILKRIRESASQGSLTYYATRMHTNSICFVVKPITFGERWKAFLTDYDYSEYGFKIYANDADVHFVIDTLRKCGYDVSDTDTHFGMSLSFDISWRSFKTTQ